MQNLLPYGDLTKLNTERLILDTIGSETLESISMNYMYLLGTSSAIYEKNGDYALGIFTAGWCRLLDSASRKLCGTDDNREALESGKWLCHESCWTSCGKKAIETGKPVDIVCHGGLHLFGTPIFAGETVIGAMNMGYGALPKDRESITEIANLYKVDTDELVKLADEYKPKPADIIDGAKHALTTSAKLIGSIVQSKMTEASLKESVDRFESYFNNPVIGIAITSIEKGWIEVNKRLCSMLGYSKEELSKMTWSELTHPDDLGKDVELFNKVSTGEIDSYSLEKRFLTKGGDELWTELGVSCRRKQNGEIDYFIATLNDISMSKENEKQLEQSRDFLNRSQAIAHVGSWHLDLKKNVLTWSDENYRIFGFEPGEVAPTYETFVNCVHPDDREYVNNTYTHAIENKIPYEATHRILRKDGTVITVYEVSEEIYDENGNAIASIGMTLDITELHDAQEKLRESEALLKEAQRVANIGSWSYDYLNEKVVWSDQMYRILEMDPAVDEIEPEMLRNMFVPEDRERQQRAVKDAIEKGIGYDHELRIALKNGQERIINTIGRPVKNEHGEIVRLVGAMRDVTRQKELERMEKNALEHEKMALIGRVAGKMAHDFNNVLGITLGTSELLLTEDLPMEVISYVKAIKQSAERGREITQNLLFFAKDKEAKYGQIDLNDNVMSILTGLKSEMENIDLHLDYGRGLDQVTADASLLDNAIINIIKNAIHAVSKEEKPSISISTKRIENKIFIEVKDNGCGIPEEHQKHIFEPSFTLKGSMDKYDSYERGIKGSGYGLANTKRGIEKHGGTISFESKVGEGTTFRIAIPVIDIDLEPEIKEQLSNKSTAVGKRILVVEDEVHFANILYRLLRDVASNVHLASSGMVAMDKIATNEYDAISLDFILPDSNGMEIYETIRKKDKNVPVVFVSGNFEFMKSMIALKENDPKVDLLTKPFNNVDYVNKICEWLKP